METIGSLLGHLAGEYDLALKYNCRYIVAMKTAVSIPDVLFAEAEHFARNNHLSRHVLRFKFE